MFHRKKKCLHDGEKEVTKRVFVLCADCHVIMENVEHSKYMLEEQEMGE